MLFSAIICEVVYVNGWYVNAWLCPWLLWWLSSLLQEWAHAHTHDNVFKNLWEIKEISCYSVPHHLWGFFKTNLSWNRMLFLFLHTHTHACMRSFSIIPTHTHYSNHFLAYFASNMHAIPLSIHTYMHTYIHTLLFESLPCISCHQYAC
jgi:hypothetical protein